MSPLPDHLLSRLSEQLAGQMGWHFPAERWHELQAGIENAAREAGVANVHEYARSLLREKLNSDQVEALAGAFTVGETYFFRDPQSFDILEQSIFPALIDARRASERRLRIWSAGCCTGEEAYSISILLDRMLPNQADWQITILATDINVRFLQKAAQGVFGEWSFRGAPAWLQPRYFRPAGQRRFELLPRIRSRVTFAYLNLIDDAYPSLTSNTNAMDLILCRNVLMYFSPDLAIQVIRNFHRSLRTDGWFLTSAVETSPRLSGYFEAAPLAGSTFYRRRSEGEGATGAATFAQAASDPIDVAADFTRFVAMPDTQYQANQALPEPIVNGVTATAVPQHEPLAEPDTLRAAYDDAIQLFARGRYQQAADRFLTQRAAAETDVDSAILLARGYANIGDLQAALTWIERAIHNDRTNALTHYLRAEILQEQNQLAEAASALQRTLYLQPQFVLAHFALGNLEQRQGRRSAATRHFNNALRLLQRLQDDDVLPHSDGMVAGGLKEMIRSIASADAV